MSPDRFLADGRDRLLNDPAVRAQLEAAATEIEARYAPMLRQASFLERFVLRHRMQAEVRQVVERLAPSDALYVAAASTQPLAATPLDVRRAAR